MEAENIEGKDNSGIHDFEQYIFHNGHEFSPDNFQLCMQRLKKFKNRLTLENLVQKYDGQNKIIEKVPFDEVPKNPGPDHYLPHRPVLREDKETTKIRAVFDGSCASDRPSLNDCLYSGPNLLSKIFDILLGFNLTLLRF